MKNHPTVHIIAGSNGSGKTTFALEFFPKVVGSLDFINADLIAKGLSPFDSDKMVVRASRIFLQRIEELTEARKDFVFETTLSGLSYVAILRHMKKLGYNVHMYYLWIPNYELAIERIKGRVLKGGHNVPSSVVIRRFKRTLKNLFHTYLPLIDYLVIFNNSSEKPQAIFEKTKTQIHHIDYELSKKIIKEVGWNE